MAKLCHRQESGIQTNPTETQGMEPPSMRYDPQDRWYSKDNHLKPLRRARRRKPQPKPISLISVDGIVTSKPRSECTIFQKHPKDAQSEADFRKLNREEVTVTAVLHLGATTAPYVVRFVHKRCIEAARRLMPGTRIRIDAGFFNYRAGRESSEFWVKQFHLLNSTDIIRPTPAKIPQIITLTFELRGETWLIAV